MTFHKRLPLLNLRLKIQKGFGLSEKTDGEISDYLSTFT